VSAERIAELKRKLAKREGRGEYRDNIEAIKAEIARLEANMPPSDPEE
jgi:hypothetical protein